MEPPSARESPSAPRIGRSHDRATESQGSTERAEDRAKSEPEDGVADTGQRAHHTDLHALNRSVLDLSTVGAVLLKCEGDADDGSGHVRMRVVELHVTLERRDLVLLVGVELLDRGDHREAPAAVLHADDGSGHVRMRVVELHVTLERRDLVLLVGVELLDRGDHREAPAAVLHTLVVPRALQELEPCRN